MKNAGKMTQVLNRARESLKLFEMLDKRGTWTKSKYLGSETLLTKFKSMGFASQAELSALQAKVERLETALSELEARTLAKPGRRKPIPTSTEAFPKT